MVYAVELKKIPAVKVISLRGIIPQYNQEGILWEKLGCYVGEKEITCHSDGYSTFFDEEYKKSDIDVEIAIPVYTMGTSEGDFVFKEYEEISLAATNEVSETNGQECRGYFLFRMRGVKYLILSASTSYESFCFLVCRCTWLINTGLTDR